MDPLRTLVFAGQRETGAPSYIWDWVQAFEEHPRLATRVVETGRTVRVALDLLRAGRRQWDLVIFPYGFYYRNEGRRSLALFQALGDLSGTKFFFLQNEFRVLNHKLAVATVLGADYVVSQFPLDAALRAYRPFFRPEQILSPPPGLPTALFDRLPREVREQPRDLDLDLTGESYPQYLGHRERDALAELLEAIGPKYGLKVSVRLGSGKRLPRPEWIRHLHRCKGVLSHEAGSDYLETNDATRERVNAYQAAHPEASFAELHRRFFQGYADPLPGRCLSTRHMEAIGAGACQILLRGRYSDVLAADEHYLALERDFSNLEDVLDRFQDEGTRRRVTQAAERHARTKHTLNHRVDALIAAAESGGI